ncbi:phage tail tape measure protein [Kineosporia sp. R_H_3]|uniref:phage tail tape measure protein n=1 Tax=Kineosporia sp. R_H_3 TaxID=1961848 RepID=UPI000B4B4032|nr:phage tail tape measure protein [Kineosporia sp. R_H_3]
MALFGGDRSVAVRLTADVKGYVAGMAAASKKAQDFGKAAVESAGKHRRAFDEIGTSAIGAGIAIGAVATTAVVAFAKFDQAMSRAAAGTTATGASLTALREAALKAGAQTQYSATEAADAITALGKAGVGTADILGGGLDASLSLAAAGQLEVGKAAEIAATAMTQFNLKGKDIGKVADLLAAGAGKAQGDVTDLANALKYVGPVAASMNVSIEETTGVLALFASQGIIGEQAGTSLRGMLGSLTSPSEAAAEQIKALGINLYDAQGSFLGLQNVAGQLQGALGGMSDAQRDAALGTIFGNEQITAAKVLYAGGADAVKEWTTAVDDTGFAAQQAQLLMNNLAGDVEQLKGSFETALIQSGSGANDGLRALTQTATDAVNVFGVLPESVQKNTVVIAGVTAATLLLTGGMLKGAVAVKTMQTNMAELGVSAGRARGAMAALGKAATVATVLSFAPDISAAVDKSAGNVGDSVSQMALELAKFGKGSDLAGEAAKTFGSDLDGLADRNIGNLYTKTLGLKQAVQDLSGSNGFFRKDLPFLGSPEATQIEQYSKALAQLAQSDAPAAAQAFDRLSSSAGLTSDETSALLDLMPQYKDYLTQVATQQVSSGESAAGAADATSVLKEQMAGASYSAEQLAQDLTDANAEASGYADAVLDARSATRDYQAALDDARAALKENGKTLDDTTPKGRANAAALDAVAAAAQQQATAILNNKGTQEDYRASLVKSREELVTMATKFLGSKTAAEKYADSVLQIPKKVTTTVTFTGAGTVKDNLDQIRAKVRALTGRRFNIDIGAPGGTALADGGVIHRYAGGGFENHTAQIARGGPIRLWNEPETEGEAYIPLAGSKRSRSKAILAEVAKIFGMVAYADGGFGQATPFGLSDVSQRYEAARPKPITAKDYTAAINAAKNATLAQQKAERDLRAARAAVTETSAAQSRAERSLAAIRRNTPRDTKAIHAAEDRLDRARRASASARTREANAEGTLDRARRTKTTAQARQADAVTRKNAPKGFSLAGYTKALAGTVAQTTAFRGNLKRIAGRGGNQLAALIEGMGDDGIQLAAALAKAKPAEFTRVVALLRQLDPAAFAPPAAAPASGVRTIAFAAGGIENHTAQIARGGPIRMWAEPETGGEAYIPLAASKQARSRMIASDVVDRLGGAVAWSTARAGGRGSISAAPSGALATGATPTVSVGTMQLIRGGPQDVASELMFRFRAAG